MNWKRRFLAALIASGIGGWASAAAAASPYAVIPPDEVLRASPAYRYANMTDQQALAELGRRGVPYLFAGQVPGVRVAVRLTGPLHGVDIHSSLPADERAGSMFEVLDARLALALDDFSALLAKHDIVELVHYTMYRPNVAKPDADPGSSAAKNDSAAKNKGALFVRHAEKGKSGGAIKDESASEPDKAKSGKSKKRGKARRSKPKGQKSKTAKNGKNGKSPAAQTSPKLAKSAPAPVDPPAAKAAPIDEGAGQAPAARPHKSVKKRHHRAQPSDKPAPEGQAQKREKHGKTHPARHRHGKHEGQGAPAKGAEGEQAAKAAPSIVLLASYAREVAPAAAPVKKTTWAPPGTRHPAGLAIDVGELRKRDGRWLRIADEFGGHIGAQTCGAGAKPPATADGRELWSIVCEAEDRGLFSYVLTPNYNAAHFDHFHMEIKPASKLVLFQ